MKATIIEKSKKIISDRRFDNENTALNNKIEALKDPTFKTLYNDYVSAMIENAKNNIENDENVQILYQKMQKRLSELNIGSIFPVYSCKKCNDSGYFDSKFCDCLIDEMNKILVNESGFLKLEKFEDANFELFENKQFMITLYSKMQKWCHSNFDKSIIFLSGPTGVGKTHLIECMASELISLHKVVYFTTSFAMHQDFVKSYSSRDPEEKQSLLDRYLNAEVLFIDDLGTELRQPNITINYLYQVINERKLKKLPTIITSNLRFSEILDYYDERISSRLADKTTSVCIYIEGEDLRIK